MTTMDAQQLQTMADGVRSSNLRALGRAITLIESSLPEHRQAAQELLEILLPATGNALRIGISGVPGVGKSTFIEAFGMHLIEQAGVRVAVLAVDPSSQISGGSILGDKTRMERLSRAPQAFIRPSPSGESLGGVARKTRETMLLCEAAGYNLIIVETVGVGQSETTVASMVDFFLMLQLPNAGDELQGIKRGIMEIADGIVINKADTDRQSAELARQQLLTALHIMAPRVAGWEVPVHLCSALKGMGLDDVWDMLQQYRTQLDKTGDFDARRKRQARDWMWSMLRDELERSFEEHPGVAASLDGVERAVLDGQITPAAGAHRLMDRYKRPAHQR